jgi:hypothetical protein
LRTWDSWRARLLAAAAVALCGGLLWAGCGGDDDDDGGGDGGSTEETAGPTEITVTADEYSFELSETPTEPGEVTFNFENVGKEPHAMIFARLNEGFTLEEAFELQGRKGSADELAETGARPGDKAKPVSAKLTPGDYAMVCPVLTQDGKSHFELGQREEFTIEG